jgi:hypothetical protein
MPVHFDENEWFILVTAMLEFTVVLMLPRRFPTTQIVILFVLNFFLGVVGDEILAGPPYNFYDIMDSPLLEWSDLITYLVHYPLTMYLFIYFYDKWRPRKLRLIGYMIGSVLSTIAIERVSSLFHVFSYNDWTMFDSFIVYFFAYMLNLIVLTLTARLMKANPQKGMPS